MSKKDFMRGVETSIKANEAFMRKQAEATAELGKRVVQKIDEQGKIIDVILDTLNAQEKKDLYDLQSAYDIADLGENEKEVLASFLLTLISKYGQDTDAQKDYYFAVKKHLSVTDVSPEFDLSLVENVDSRSELKAMFQTVCEFLFLKTGNTSFLNDFEEEIGYFDLSRKVIREIVEPIEKIYNVLGLRGIVEHYIPAETEVSENDNGTQLLVLDWKNGKEEALKNGIKIIDSFSRQIHILMTQNQCLIRNFPELTVEDARLTNCTFENCGQITLEEGTVNNCVFKNVGLIFANDVKIYDSRFEEMACKNDCIISMEDTKITGCTFSNIKLLNDSYIGDGVGDVWVEKCVFENIYTERFDKELFRNEETVGTVFKKKKAYCIIDEESCIGLDTINVMKYKI